MKKYKEQRAKMLMFVALGIMALIFGIMCLVSPIHAIGVTTAMAFVIGGVSYEDNEIGKALSDVTAKIEERIKSTVTKADIDALKADFIKQVNGLEDSPTKEELTKAVDDFNTKLKAQWEAVVKLTAKEAKAETKSRMETMRDLIIASGSVEKYLTEDGAEKYRFKLKGGKDEIRIEKLVDMNTASSVRPGASPGVNIGFLTDYSMIPQVLPLSLDQHFMQAGFPVSNIPDKYFGVVVEETETNGAAVKAETAAAAGSSFLWKSLEFKVFDYAAAFRVHQNTLDDMDNVLNRIQTVGVDRLLSAIDVATLVSNGDNSATAYGIANSGYYTAYDTTLRAAEVTAPTIVNVIKNAVLQAQLLNKNVNCVLLHPSDIAEIEDLKDLVANTVNLAGLKLDATGKLAYIYGLAVIRNSKVTTNTCWVLDRNESIQFGVRESAGVRIGYDQTTDFSKKIVTIQVEARIAIGIGAPAAIIYCSSISAAQTTLTAV